MTNDRTRHEQEAWNPRWVAFARVLEIRPEDVVDWSERHGWPPAGAFLLWSERVRGEYRKLKGWRRDDYTTAAEEAEYDAWLGGLDVGHETAFLTK